MEGADLGMTFLDFTGKLDLCLFLGLPSGLYDTTYLNYSHHAGVQALQMSQGVSAVPTFILRTRSKVVIFMVFFERTRALRRALFQIATVSHNENTGTKPNCTSLPVSVKGQFPED